MNKPADQAAAKAFLDSRLTDDSDLEDNDDLPDIDKPPAGFTPDDYPDDDDYDDVPGDEGEGEDDGHRTDDDGDEGDPFGDGTDPEDDDQPELERDTDDEYDDEGEQSGTEDPAGDNGGDGSSADSPIRLEAEDIDAFVQFDGLDTPMRLRDLAELTKFADTRDQYLRKHQELSDQRKALDEELTRQREVTKAKTRAAEFYDLPHVFLQSYLQDQISAGRMSGQMAQDIASVFQDYARNGEYDANGLAQSFSQQREEQQRRAAAEKEEYARWEEIGRSDMAYLEKKEGVKLDPVFRKQLGDFILAYQAENNGTLIRPKDAYALMVARGLIKRPAAVAPKTPQNVGTRIRSRRKGTVPGSSPRGTGAGRTQERKDAEAAFRAMRG